jgi:thiamine-monophosphate kinase
MEAEFVDWLRRRLPECPGVQLGIGDDAAVYRPSVGADGRPLPQVVTTDLLCEGVHFLWDQAHVAAVGRKALAVNLSDLAAMAAVPRAAVVGLLWPRARSLTLARQLYEGLLDLADVYQVAIVGGDTNSWQGPLVIDVTLWGEATERGVLTRHGARPGDAILVTGQLGGSLAGKHLTFQPRVREALHLQGHYRLHAGMDISDGLSLDLYRLTQASGVGAELDTAAIPISAAAHQASGPSGRSPLDHALSDGEDFELLLVMPVDEAERLLADQPIGVPLTRVGTIVPEQGLWQRNAQGNRVPLAVTGYLH